jgi:hypothetical protein
MAEHEGVGGRLLEKMVRGIYSDVAGEEEMESHQKWHLNQLIMWQVSSLYSYFQPNFRISFTLAGRVEPEFYRKSRVRVTC